MHVLPRPLPSKVVKGEHFVLADLLKLLPEGSTFGHAGPQACPQVVTKKKKKSRQVKAAGEGLEGFVN